MASSSRTQIKPCSNLSGKVRVVARVRGFSDQELASHSSTIISVHKSGDSGPFEKVKLSFDDQTSSRKNEYEVDCCYVQNEDTSIIFSKEIKPHISRVFDGENSTFIAFGARGSGKTYTIQGSEENLGLGILAMDEILKIVEGGKHAVAVSIYEVFQNHVYDLLDSKNPEVQVLEDAQGKIILKGLSKVPVNSMLEFQKLYCSGSKSTQKIPLELPRRSHKALMIHILACDEGTNSKCVGNMNFIDLAGYENARRNSISISNDAVEGTQINKSLSALLHVIQAINANESRVPYRESKLARVLQDSLGGNNHISLLVCMNPLFCPDTIHVATLASRLKSIKSVDVSFSAKKQSKPVSANRSNSICSASTTTKITKSRLLLSSNKTNVPLKGRDLFGGTEQAKGIKEQMENKVNSDAIVCSATKKQINSRFPLSAKKTNVLQKPRDVVGGKKKENGIKEQVLSMVNNPSNIMTSDGDSTDVKEVNNPSNIMTPDGDSTVVKEENCTSDDALLSSDASLTCSPKEDIISKENDGLLFNEGPSPPPSVGLKNILNRLQSLELKNNLEPQDDNTNTQVSNFVVDNVEPKTPMLATNKMDISDCQTGTFSKRSSGMKQSLVQNYLQFLNSASKDDLKGIRGIGEKRATYILELREESPEPFKSLDDLEEIGLSSKQVKNMMKNVAGGLFG